MPYEARNEVALVDVDVNADADAGACFNLQQKWATLSQNGGIDFRPPASQVNFQDLRTALSASLTFFSRDLSEKHFPQAVNKLYTHTPVHTRTPAHTYTLASCAICSCISVRGVSLLTLLATLWQFKNLRKQLRRVPTCYMPLATCHSSLYNRFG